MLGEWWEVRGKEFSDCVGAIVVFGEASIVRSGVSRERLQ